MTRSLPLVALALALAPGCQRAAVPAAQADAAVPPAGAQGPEPSLDSPATPLPDLPTPPRGESWFRFPAEPEAAVRPAEAPMSLTATDGTGLRLVRLAARAVVEEPLAFTELRLAFQNPEARVIEGHFRITLPQGATVSRFAMKVGESWQEGEVVERQAARRAYEDFLHRRQDPALLEQGGGNEFTARVFPIPASGVKDLILSYSQELSGPAGRWALPLRGLPELGELDVAVFAGGKQVQKMQRVRYVPNADLGLEPGRVPHRAGLRHGELALVRVRPVASSAPDPIASVVFLLDTSASRALGYRDQVRLLQRLIEGLAAGTGPEVPVTVACFDQTVQEVFSGPAGSFGEDALKRIRERRALGASDLQRALGWAGQRAPEAPARRVILITDGVATAGAVEGDELRAAVSRLRAAGVERMDAIAVGGIRDDAMLRQLVTAGLPRDGVVVDGSEELESLARRLTEATRSKVEVAVEGASWWWPRRLSGVQAGDEVLVYAELPASAPVRLSLDGEAAAVMELPTVERPLLERSLAQARIAGLQHSIDVEADGPEQKAALRQRIVELSVKHRVLSRYTALLVLETERDYQRFGIDRRALADILTVEEAGRLALTRRKGDPESAPGKDGPVPRVAERKADRSQREKSKGSAAGSMDLEGGPTAAMEADGKPDEAMAMRLEEAPAPSPRGELPARAAPSPSSSLGNIMDLLTGSGTGANALAGREAASGEAPARRRTLRDFARGPAAADEPGFRPPAAPPPSAGGVEAYTGRFKEVMDLLAKGEKKAAHQKAFGWREEDPGDVMALVALGEAFEAMGELEQAARAYGSIIDLFSSRADLRRFAGARLERLAKDAGLDLATDTYGKAAAQRPDHPAGHRLHAFALLKKGQREKAFEAVARGLRQHYPEGRFSGVGQILREDLGLVAAAWIKAEPGRRKAIVDQVAAALGALEEAPSLRFVLTWETDANDVDFHIRDGKGSHAFYSQPRLASGGNLYADVTTGYGPECFTIRLPRERRAYPYSLQAHYYSRGPMGYGMGKLQIIDHDGKGGITFEERTFVVMADQAFVDLGTVAR